MRRDTIFRIASLTKPVVATAAMMLVDDGTLALAEPVDRLLPELANRRVLKRVDGPLDDTVPANRPLTLRDLLTFRLGLGYFVENSSDYPIQAKLNEYHILQGPNPQGPPAPDEWIRNAGTLPLVHQPGERWMYDFGSDVLGVLIARAADQPLEAFLQERIFSPLGMKDTGFCVPPAKIDRLAAGYMPNAETGALELSDDPATGQWSRPPAFPSGGGGLVSTVDDYLAFAQMLLNGGRLGRERILSRPTVELMLTNQLTPEQKASAGYFIPANRGWGFGLSMVIQRTDLTGSIGSYGWWGGSGTAWLSDPQEELITILLTQRAVYPHHLDVDLDFWAATYAAIDD
jgi:CubicO group peptidase (beta-lactamase class C family)